MKRLGVLEGGKPIRCKSRGTLMGLLLCEGGQIYGEPLG
jgi:hypothetical protein